MLTYNTLLRDKIGKLTMCNLKDTKVDYGVSITDKSHYNPSASTFLSNQGALNSTPLYHFNDGVDNGLNMAALTNKNLDRTEKEDLYNKLRQKTGEEIDKLIESIESLEQSSNDDIDDNKDSTDTKD